MRCPRCDEPMQAVGGDQFSAHRCASCGGLFYPSGEFLKHLELAEERLSVEPVGHDAGGGTAAAIAGDKGPWLCPGCGSQMGGQTRGSDAAAVLECGVCRGVWVQTGEIEHLARVLREHRSLSGLSDEVLDRYARALLDEDRGRRKLEELKEFGQPKASVWALPFFTFMPVSDAEDVWRFSLATWGVIALNVLLLIFGRGLFGQMAMVPSEVCAGLRLHTLITYQFAHGGVLHLLVNMWFLRAFGDRVEDRLGPWRFLAFYLVMGVVAGLAQAFMDPDSTVPCVGASGSISGIMGLYLVMFPTLMVRVVVSYSTVRVPALLYLGAWFGAQALLPASGNVAVAAHLGGFLAGAWVGGLVRALRLGAPRRVEA